MNPMVHFEMPVKNARRAQDFYSKTFGWKIEQWQDNDYWMVTTTETDKKGMPLKPGSINGAFYKQSTKTKNPIPVIAVSDISGYLDRAKAAGAKVVQKKNPVGDMGFYAQIRDTEGNLVGLWESASAAG